jgi:hypothetical protein
VPDKVSVTSTRHLIFLIVLLAVAVPVIFNVKLSHTSSPETRQVYAAIDSLPTAGAVLVSFDFEASSFAEVRPLAEAMIRHCFRKNLRIIGVSLFAEGTALGEQVLSDVARREKKSYGSNYVYLGFRPQYTSAILALGESIIKEFPSDYFGAPTATMPVLAGVTNYGQIAAVISIADGGMPTYWVDYAVTPHRVKLLTALTATMATSYYPYLSSGQIAGIVAGLKGAAEYEDLLGETGAGGRGLFAQSVSQVVILLVIVAGNVVEYFGRRRGWK